MELHLILNYGTNGVQKAEATPVAGAKEFLQFADKNKVQIYYISDRLILR